VVAGKTSVPSLLNRAAVIGEVEAWVADSKGKVVAAGVPWEMPGAQGTYFWSIPVPVEATASLSKCLVENIDPRQPFARPQGTEVG
jgi:hypothetical protein